MMKTLRIVVGLILSRRGGCRNGRCHRAAVKHVSGGVDRLKGEPVGGDFDKHEADVLIVAKSQKRAVTLQIADAHLGADAADEVLHPLLRLGAFVGVIVT
jgi:hypothetical protein